MIRFTQLVLQYEWWMMLGLAPVFIAPLAFVPLTLFSLCLVVGLYFLRVTYNQRNLAAEFDPPFSNVPLFNTVLDGPLLLLALTLPGAVWASTNGSVALPALSIFVYGLLMYYATVRYLRMGGQRSILLGLTLLGLALALVGVFTIRSPAQKLPLLQGVFDLIPRLKPPASFGGKSRELGGFFHPNILAITLAMLLPFAAMFTRVCKGWARDMAGAGVLVMGIVLLLTASRTAVGMLLVAVLLVSGFRWRWLWLIGLALALVGFGLVQHFGLEALLGSGVSPAADIASGLGGRQQVWIGAWQTLLDFPFLPVAFGSFNDVSKGVIGRLPELALGGWDYHAHNIELEYAVNFGLLGFAACIAMLITLACAGWERIRHTWHSHAAACISLLTFSLFGAIDALSPLNKTGWIFFVSAAMLVGLEAPQPQAAEKMRLSRKAISANLWQLLGVGLVITFVIVFQFRATPIAALQENIGLAYFNQAVSYGFRETFNDSSNAELVLRARSRLEAAAYAGSPTAKSHLDKLSRVFANMQLPVLALNEKLQLTGGDLRWVQAIAPPDYSFGTRLNPSGPSIGMLWWDGRASVALQVDQPGLFTVTLRTQHANPAPILLGVGVDGHIVKTFSLARGDNSWEDISCEVMFVSGMHSLDVNFLNDGSEGGKDRNAAVDTIVIQRVR